MLHGLRAGVVALAVAVVLALLPLSAAQPGKAAVLTPERLMTLKQINAVRVSPDGQRVLFAVKQAVLDGDRSEYLTHIHLANADGSQARQLTQGGKSCD